MSATESRRVRKTVPTPGRRLTWATWPSTHTAPSLSTQPAMALAIWRTGAGACGEVSSAMGGSLVTATRRQRGNRGVTPAHLDSAAMTTTDLGLPPAHRPDRPRRAAGRPPRLLRRRRPGGGDGREGARPLRRPGLRAQADRPQQARRGRPRVARRDLRRGARRGARGRDRGVLRARRLAGGARAGRRARPEDHRRDLPAGDQGAPRGEAVRRPGLRHPADRPRGARGGRGHLRRGARPHPAGAGARRRRRHRGARPVQGGLALADHAVGRRDPRDGRRRSASGSPSCSTRRATTSATPPRTASWRSRRSPATPTW